ncbi:M81 family metallopeptidase [Parasphingopyxis algicola]|uniref:M81 family metallopeptidase n=1 Tax=Parasphingopyxis algicola TaxID=2026624 RepID=UPI00159FD7A8|nr:M81 family metallopeptidase [Parasphingopyxis algicola]QLC23927.1 M81 family metallopeptidase [Parasphingopyxis algicola]
MKIFACGLGTETNSFCPIPTSADDFSNDLFEGFVPGKRAAFGVWAEKAEQGGHEFSRGSNMWAMPAGPVVEQDYLALRAKLLGEIEAVGCVDILLLYLHGAMMATQTADCEGEFLKMARDIVGSDTVIGVEIDPHANISRAYAEYADVVIAYKEWPHDDIADRAEELFDLCIAAAQGDIQPQIAIAEANILSFVDTKSGAGQEIIREFYDIERRPEILSASLTMGFAWSDTPALGTRTLIVSDGDADLAQREAQRLADTVRERRGEIAIGHDAVKIKEAIARAQAEASKENRFALCEGADAILCGGAGDATHLLEAMIDANLPDAVFAPLWDPVAIDLCTAAGEGTRLDLRIGGKASRVSGRPLDLTVTVRAIRPDYRHAVSPTFGFDGGTAVHVATDSGFDIILSSKRFPILAPTMFDDFGIDLETKRILGLKAFRMARVAFADVVGTFQTVLTQGAMSEDVRSLPYRNAPRNLWPLEAA